MIANLFSGCLWRFLTDRLTKLEASYCDVRPSCSPGHFRIVFSSSCQINLLTLPSSFLPLSHRPLEQLSLAGLVGFIVNVPSNVCLGFLSLPVRRRHWIAVRQLDGIYYNLDSKLKAPAPIGGEADLRYQ